LLKFVVAFGLVAVALVFLGVNFVPRISAFSSANKVVDPKIYIGSDWIERHPSNYYIGSDWIERHPATASGAGIYDNSDWIIQHMSDSARAKYYAGSDWIERHPSNYYAGSDWIERHPVQPTP
jgi:hypothetical protein